MGANRAAVQAATAKALTDIDAAMGIVKDSEEAARRKAEEEAKAKNKKVVGGFEDKIDEAANDITDARDEFSQIPQAIKDLSTELADLMQKMAEAARNGDKVGIVQNAKLIAAVVKKIQKETKEYGKNPKFGEGVVVGCQALGNFSVQAATTGFDPEAEAQLVSCCEGMASSMRSTLF